MSKLGIKLNVSLRAFHWLPIHPYNFKDWENEFPKVGVFDESEFLTVKI